MHATAAHPASDSLEGQSVRLVPFADRHLTDAYVAWLNDPDVTRFSENRHRRHTLESCQFYRDSLAADGHPFWAIEWTVDGRHIGNITAYRDRPNLRADVAIMIGDPALRGTGLAREAWRLAIEHLLTAGGLAKVTAGTMANNLPMRRLCEGSGMILEATLPRHFLWNGNWIDQVLYSRFAAPASEPLGPSPES